MAGRGETKLKRSCYDGGAITGHDKHILHEWRLYLSVGTFLMPDQEPGQHEQIISVSERSFIRVDFHVVYRADHQPARVL